MTAKRQLLLGLLLLLALLLVVQPALARSYTFLSLRIEAIIEPDGSMHVEERRTTRFDGQFSGMYQYIDTSSGIRIRDIELREGSTVYERNPSQTIGPPGTFFVRTDPRETYIDWSYSANNQTLTFILSYVVENAVVVHDDVAELYYQFVGDKWDQGVDFVDVTLKLPEGAGVGDLRAWGHGPLHGEVTIVDGQTVRWEVAPLPGKTMLEGRVTFPPALLAADPPYAERQSGAGLPGILEEEQRWARQANIQRWLARLELAFGIILALGGLFAAVWSYRRFGREHKTQFDGEYYRELPADYSPAEMSVLYTMGTVGSNDMTATIMDLGRRKYLSIEERPNEKRGLLRRGPENDYILTKKDGDGSELAPHEQELLSFFFNVVDSSKSGSVSFRDLEDFAKKRRTTFASFWSKWQKLAKDRSQQHQFFDKTIQKPRFIVGGVSAVLLAAGFGAFVIEWFALGIGAFVGGGCLMLAAFTIRRRSPKGAEEYQKWRAFRRFLEHFSEMQRHEIPSLILWEHFLVYAVSLGVAKEVLKQLQIVYPNLEQNGYRFGRGWLMMNTARMTNFDQSLSQMTTSMEASLRQSVRTATSSSSSGSGGGGGFSGGGGGGRGGGGGGVR